MSGFEWTTPKIEEVAMDGRYRALYRQALEEEPCAPWEKDAFDVEEVVLAAVLAAVEEGDGCEACATLLDAFLDGKKKAKGNDPNDLAREGVIVPTDLSLGEDWQDREASKDHVAPEQATNNGGEPAYPEGFSEWPRAKQNDWFAEEAKRYRYFKQLDQIFEEAERAKAQEAPTIILRGFNPADWEGVKAPQRLWVVPDYIPDRTVTLLYADGGTGKSYLKLQLAVARARAEEWIGLMPEPGRTLVLSTEDDIDEMHRRIEGYPACRFGWRKFNPGPAHERHNRTDANLCRARRLHSRIQARPCRTRCAGRHVFRLRKRSPTSHSICWLAQETLPETWLRDSLARPAECSWH
jgi:hypothetical protein